MTKIHELGGEGRTSEVHNATSEMSWRLTVKLHGPAFRRRYASWLRDKPPKVIYAPTAKELQRVATEKILIERWNVFVYASPHSIDEHFICH
jgi:hypothetical protein